MGGARSSRGWRRLPRPALLVAGAALALPLLWLLLSGLAAQHYLSSSGAALEETRRAIEAGERDGALDRLAGAQRAAARARSLTGGPIWRTAAAVPWLGSTPHAVTVAAEVADRVTRSVLPPLADAAAGLDADALRRGNGLDLAPLKAVAPAFAQARRDMVSVQRRADSIDGTLIWPVGGRVRDLRRAVASLSSAIDLGARATRLLPTMMGADGKRTYLLAVQNPAEARGTGGLLGAYGVVDVADGMVTMREIGPNSALRDADRLPLDLGEDFDTLYGDDPALWVNANLSPYFPYAARIWLRLWDAQFHEQLDGVVALDPIALGRLVGATRPVTLPDGTRLTGATTADFVMRDVYRRYPSFEQAAERDVLLADIGADMARHLFESEGDVGRLVRAARTSADQGRILLFSAHPDEQRRLAGTRISGAPALTSAPRLQVVVNNGAANKLDYYLDRTVRWDLGRCDAGHRTTRVTVTLRSDAPETGLPAYVLGNQDLPADGVRIPLGTNRLLVTVFSTRGARLVGAELDGGRLAVRRGLERGQTVTGLTVDLAPGQQRTAVLELVEPARPEQPTIAVQPLVRPQHSVVKMAHCVS